MKIRVRGEMSIAEIRQALWEKLAEAEDDLAIRYSRGATLYINPTNGFGQDVIPRGERGEKIKDLNSDGPYKSAADEFKI